MSKQRGVTTVRVKWETAAYAAVQAEARRRGESVRGFVQGCVAREVQAGQHTSEPPVVSSGVLHYYLEGRHVEKAEYAQATESGAPAPLCRGCRRAPCECGRFAGV